MNQETVEMLTAANASLEAELALQRKEQEALRAEAADLRALLLRLYRLQEEERSRLARELHDDAGQALTGIKMDTVWLKHCFQGEQAPLLEKVQTISSLVDGAVCSLRRVMGELRPGILDDLGLAAAVEWQLHEFQSRTGIAYLVDDVSDEPELDTAVCSVLFRIFRELLDNVRRHAAASRVEVEIYQEEGNLVLQVKDNGRGLTETEIHSRDSLGLRNIREEAAVIGAHVAFRGIPNRGTIVTIQLPLNAAPDSQSQNGQWKTESL